MEKVTGAVLASLLNNHTSDQVMITVLKMLTSTFKDYGGCVKCRVVVIIAFGTLYLIHDCSHNCTLQLRIRKVRVNRLGEHNMIAQESSHHIEHWDHIEEYLFHKIFVVEAG